MSKYSLVVLSSVVAIGLFVSCISFSDKDRLRSSDYSEFETWHKVNPEPLIGDGGANFRGSTWRSAV